MNYAESLAWLYSARFSGIKPGLETIRRLLAALGSPERGLRFLHVAGTNGKGSVCALLDRIARAAGIRTGLYTSPHLCSFRERIRVDGRPIPQDAVSDAVTRLRRLVAGWDPHPTFFEMTTALALEHFARERAELVILETGMGGRLDATNVVTPLVSLITRIALDHREWLGSTLSEIAAEKAGILKPGIPALTIPQDPDALRVLQANAAAVGAPLSVVPPPDRHLPCALKGRHQQLHAALALRAFETADISLPPAAAQDGLASVIWPGRFQVVSDRLVLDGAHNPDAARQLALTWREEFGPASASLVLACLADKDAPGIVRALASITSEFVVTRVSNPRSLDVASLARIARLEAPEAQVQTASDPPSALELAQIGKRRVLAAGSLFLIGELLAHLGLADPDPPLPVVPRR